MSTDANKFWSELSRKSARANRRDCLTPQEAQAEYDAAPAEPIDESEIEKLVDAVVDGRCSELDDDTTTWKETEDLDAPVLCLNRNPASVAPANDSLLDEHRRKALGTAKPNESRSDWKELEARVRFAQQQAAQVLDVLHVKKYPIDPAAVVASEAPRLEVIADDFGDRFDGQLEYHPAHKKFLLFVNTKYDALGVPERTRFSLAHELGHFFLDDHRRYLMGGGKAHASRSEFSKTESIVEREADAFAAALLLPDRLFSPLVNEDELTLDRIESLAADFRTSRVSTAIRSIEVSHFPCAVAGIREGKVAWQFASQALIEGGCYPGAKGSPASPTAVERWAAFVAGDFQKCSRQQLVRHWFRTYDRVEHEQLPVTEFFLPVPAMRTLVVMLTVPEGELFPDSDDD
jgi:Zn-dependent peptidase ImmA (M78 family)